MRQLLSLTVLALAASMAQAQFRVLDIQTCLGWQGPSRDPVYDFGDQVFIRGKIIGASRDVRENIHVEFQRDVYDPEGKIVEHGEGTVEYPQLYGNEAPLNISFSIYPTWKSGDYTMKATLKDKETGMKSTVTQKFTVLPQRLAILPPQFFSDKEGNNIAPNGGFAGSAVHYKWQVVGLNNSKGAIDCEVVIQLRDRTGQKILKEIGIVRNTETDPEKIKEIEVMTSGGNLPLASPGDFVLHLVAKDHMAGKTVFCDVPLHVEAAGKGMRFEGGSREMPVPPAITSTPPSLIQVSSPPK